MRQLRCPECGAILQEFMLTVIPPIHRKQCPNCGKSWEKHTRLTDETFDPTGWEKK